MPAYFKEDPNFVDNLLHWRGSLNPIGDKVRREADRIRDKARSIARAEVADAEAAANATLEKRFSKSGKANRAQARALAYSLRVYADLIYAAEIHQPDENIAIVASGHAASAMVEFGGRDAVIKAGETPLVYEARHILRRSL